MVNNMSYVNSLLPNAIKEQLDCLQILIKELPKDISAIDEIDKKISELLKDASPFSSALKKVKTSIVAIKIKIEKNQPIDLPIAAVKLSNLVRRVGEPVIRKCAETNHEEFELPIRKNDIARVRELILERPTCVDERGRILDFTFNLSGSAFNLACKYGALDSVSLFIQAGADPNCAISGLNPPIIAVCHGGCDGTFTIERNKTLALLLAEGANPNLNISFVDNQKNEGRTYRPLIDELFQKGPHKFHHLESFLHLLADAGMDLNVKVNDYDYYLRSTITQSPLSVAIRRHSIEVIRALIFNGAKITQEETQLVNETDSRSKKQHVYSDSLLLTPFFLRFQAIYNRVVTSEPESTLSVLAEAEGLKENPITILRIIDAYRKPTIASIRELCYAEEEANNE